MNIFDFGSYLRELLLNDEDIAEKVGTKIYKYSQHANISFHETP